MSNISVVIVQYSSNYGGSTISSQVSARAFSESSCEVDFIYGFSGPFVDISKERGFGVDVIPHSNWLRRQNPISFARDLWREYRAAGQFKTCFQPADYDLVYINSLVSLAPAIAARSVGLPVLWHIREQFADVGGEMQCPGGLGRAFVRAVIQRLASKVIVVSESVQKNILGKEYEGPLQVIPNAVPDSFFNVADRQEQFRRKFGLPVEGPVVGVPGTLRPVKGHAFLLRAVPRILSSEEDCHFALTGTGTSEYEEQLKHLCRSLGIFSRVHFLGTVSTMEHFYGACDVVSVPSVAESFGRTIIEAFAAETPVVATRVGGIEETVMDGTNGLLVEHGDVHQLSDAIVTLLQAPELRAQLTEQARKDAEGRYHESTYKRKIRDVASSV